MASVRSYSPTGVSLPRVLGGSAPGSAVSGPARCLLPITACRLAKSRKATLCFRWFSGFVTSTTAPIATGRSEPVPGRDFQPAVDQRLFTAHQQRLGKTQGNRLKRLQMKANRLSRRHPDWRRDRTRNDDLAGAKRLTKMREQSRDVADNVN